MIKEYKEIIEKLIEYAIGLKAEWGWKKGEIAGNGEEYKELEKTIERARRILQTPKLGANHMTESELKDIQSIAITIHTKTCPSAIISIITFRRYNPIGPTNFFKINIKLFYTAMCRLLTTGINWAILKGQASKHICCS